jgi:tyrosyl-tRNA synthetase
LNYDDGSNKAVPNKAVMVNNNDWLDSLSYLSFLRDYGRYFTVNRMLSFESVKQRLDRESPLSLLEFNYMVMQGYDFLELHRRHGTILQMGGSDQWGNLINGVDLAHKADKAKLSALTAPLLTTPDGKKMGKTVGGAIWLNSDMLSPYDYYQYWRNVDDAMVGVLLRKFTALPIDEIVKLENLQGSEINEAKKILAFEATKMCHGEENAKNSQDTAQKTFEQGSVGSDLPSVIMSESVLDVGVSIVSILKDTGLVSSGGEAKRLIKGGGARVNDIAISSLDHIISLSDMTDDNYIKISAGKKKHALVKTS